jgi:hypothetical protein
MGDEVFKQAARSRGETVDRRVRLRRLMGVPRTTLLAAGSAPAWERIEGEQRRLAVTAAGGSVEERLRRGQRLSAQAARLRRAIVRDEPSDARS